MSSSTKIICIDPEIFGKNKHYYDELKSSKIYTIIEANTVEVAMKEIYKIKFEEVFIIVRSSLFSQFHHQFKNNLNKICMIPKIVIFNDESSGLTQNIINDKFYNLGGAKTDFQEVKNFIKSQEVNEYKLLLDKTDEEYLNFDYIDKKEKLVLPLFYKFLIKFTEKDNDFNNFLFKKYYTKSKAIKHFLDSISNLPEIPIEILSKYYVRIYSDEDSKFYNDLNKSLRKDKKEKYLPFIKILYQGIKLRALPFSSDKELYRGGILPKKEIEKLEKYKQKGKIEGLPGPIVFSKTFLSFSKDKDVAYYFIKNNKNRSNKKCSQVLFILEREINIDYNISTHVDVGELSLIPSEREVLFFPFSSFEIKDIKYLENEGLYNIELLYLARYIDKYKVEFSTLPKSLPDSEYKTQIIESNLIDFKDIESTNTRDLYEKFNNYRIDSKSNLPNRIPNTLTNIYNIRKDFLEKKDHIYPTPELSPPVQRIDDIIISNKPINSIRRSNTINYFSNVIPEENYITGYFLITDKDINQNIRIINSFEESKRRYNYIKVQNELRYNNEKEIINKCEIIINGTKLKNFAYFIKFRSPGEYVIIYKFKSHLNRTDFMFSECTKLKQLDLENFKSKEVTNMSCMFIQCISLEDLININSLDTQNVIDMSGMFYGCESLTILDISKFNTQKVENMSLLFFGCKSLFDLNLSGFNTQNVKDMYSMFSGCSSLSSLYLQNFYTQNVTNMNRMFSDCQSLEELNLSNFYTNKVRYMNSMFYGCSSLSNLDISNISLENIINMDDMFRGCFSLKIENINCKIKNFLIKRCHLYN